MKYFTKELWANAQSANDKNSNGWEIAHQEYASQLDRLKDRISADSFNFFKAADIHDGELMSVVVIDGSRPAPLGEPKSRWRRSNEFPVTVKLTILDAYDRDLWEIEYRQVRRHLLDYPTSAPLFYRDGEGFGDLGYHELTDAGDDFLSHELLFATGSRILIEAKQITVRKQKARP